MGHIVFAAPGIRRFHLHERLRRQLLRRGHRVSVLCCDPIRATFWREQFEPVHLLRPERDEGPWDEALAAGLPRGAARRRLQRLATAAHLWLAREQPDLLLLHDERGPTARALQFAARTLGIRVLWTGDGLLPHTLQADERGIDGDSGARRWTAEDFAVVEPDQALLDASLAHALAAPQPVGLPRAEIRIPGLSRRIADACAAALAGHFATAMHAIGAWRSALPAWNDAPPPPPSLSLPEPCVALLLQRADDPGIRHDAAGAPDAVALLAAAVAAADAHAPGTPVVCTAPPGDTATVARLRRIARGDAGRVHVVPSGAAAVAAAAAAVTVTVNHPLAVVALLAGTPLVHLGSALYDVPGLTTRCTLQELPAAVRDAAQRHTDDLRRRYLTWQLRHGHVWCSATHPSHNGVLGLVQRIERAVAGQPPGPLPYRAGPSWPLSTPGCADGTGSTA